MSELHRDDSVSTSQVDEAGPEEGWAGPSGSSVPQDQRFYLADAVSFDGTCVFPHPPEELGARP